jgi:twitching motility protein PilT
MEFSQLANYAIEMNASDIHLATGKPPMLRVHGDMKPIHLGQLRAEDIMQMLHSIMSERQKQEYEKEKEIDFAIAIPPKIRFRVNAFTTINGPSAVFRLIPVEIKSLKQLGTPQVFERFTQLNKGLILVTGPTGSGKSTTLAALVNHINENHAKHIITIEDPVEFVHQSKKSLVNQREVGESTKSFAKALKSALREDPDVILVGELRDLESISLALTAAETGHLVFGTLHTSSAAKTIDRIIDVFPGDDKPMIRTMLSSSLEGVIAQRLIKKADGGGRVAVYEIMVVTTAIRNLIRENKIPQVHSLIQVGSKKGMVIMDDYVKDLVVKGVVSREGAAEILARSDDDLDLNEVANKGGISNVAQKSVNNSDDEF